MAVRLSALRAGLRFHPGWSLVFNSVTGWVDPRVIVQLEVLGQLKNQLPNRESNQQSPGIRIIVPQPTTCTLPRVPLPYYNNLNKILVVFLCRNRVFSLYSTKWSISIAGNRIGDILFVTFWSFGKTILRLCKIFASYNLALQEGSYS
jgi:hypothetical protein